MGVDTPKTLYQGLGVVGWRSLVQITQGFPTNPVP